MSASRERDGRVASNGLFARVAGLEGRSRAERSAVGRYVLAVAGVGVVTGTSIVFRPHLALATVIMLYLLPVLAAAARLGRGPSVVASILAVAAFDWFSVPPFGTFEVADTQYMTAFAVMLLVALGVSALTAELRGQAVAWREREERTAALFAVAGELVRIEDPVSIDAALARHFGSTFRIAVRVLSPDPFGVPRERRGGPGSEAVDGEAARECLDLGRPVGPGTGHRESRGAIYLPLSLAPGPAPDVIELPVGAARLLRDPARLQLAETFVRQAAAALERGRLAAETRRTQQLVEMNRLKSQFVAVAAHELRTPLTSLGMAVELLAEGVGDGGLPLDERALRMLGVAVDDVDRLRALANDLLDLSRLENRATPFELKRVPPTRVVTKAVDLALSGWSAARPSVRTEAATALPLVLADAAQAERALRNLVENAMRHAGPTGHVVVSVDEVPDFVQFSVADDGPGLPISEQDQIFEPFAGTQRTEGRAGLGLAIVRGIVRAHGGEVWVDSGPGPGAVFSFTLPTGDRSIDDAELLQGDP